MAKIRKTARTFVVELTEIELRYIAELVGGTTTSDDREIMGPEFTEGDPLYEVLTDALEA